MKKISINWWNKRKNEKLETLEKLNEAADRVIKVAEVTEKYDSAVGEISKLREELSCEKDKVSKLQSESEKLKEKIRQQTEADIYLEASKIMKRIEEGEKVTKDDNSYQKLLSLRSQNAGLVHPDHSLGWAQASLSAFGSSRSF